MLYFSSSSEYCPNTTLTLQTDEVVTMNSPFYPSFYPDNADCFWSITSEQPRGYITLSFLAFGLHPLEDFLTVGVGSSVDKIGAESTVIFRLSGSAAPRIVTVNASEGLWLRLTTNWNGQITNGFSLELQWSEKYGKLFF